MKKEFLNKGFVKLEGLIPISEVKSIRILYNNLLRDKKRTQGMRSDLSGQAQAAGDMVEKITQIMQPGRIEPKISKSIVYELALNHAKKLLGDDMELDFDMLINKAPFTDTATPWHQDAAYWIDMPDKRSVSCWIALDEVYKENGCMWFIPKEGDKVHKHTPSSNGGALYCETDTENAEAFPLKVGGCTFHDGFTLHFSKGNSTASQRRALILNFRPKAMIALERKLGVDHTGDRKVRNTK